MSLFAFVFVLLCIFGIPYGIYWLIQQSRNNVSLPPGRAADTLRESDLRRLIETAVAQANAPLHAQITALEEKVQSLERQLPPHEEDDRR